MTPYSVTHVVPLAVFLLGLPIVVLVGRRRPDHGPDRLDRGWAILLAMATVPVQVIDAWTRFDIAVSLPLHLCDLAWMAAAIALWTHHRVAVALTFYWGLVLTSQGILTPSLGEDLPDLRYFAFWTLHLLILWAAVYLVLGRGLRPGWREYRATMLVTLVWAGATYVFNEIAGTNYGYLQRKPTSGSALDLLGPWPWYVVVEIAIVAAVWAGLTWSVQRYAGTGVRHPSRGSRRRRGRSRR